MRRTRLVLALSPLWLVALGLGALLATGSVPDAATLAGLLGLWAAAVLISLLFAHHTERRQRKALSALGEALGAGAIGKASEMAHVQAMVATLCQRLERALVYQAAFEQVSQPVLIAAREGAIVKMSAGIASRAPECAETETVAALLGGPVDLGDVPGVGKVGFAGHGWQVRTVPLQGEKWLVELQRPGVVIGTSDFEAMTEALAGGDTAFRFDANALADSPELEAVNLGFSALDQSAAMLERLAHDGERADLPAANGGLAHLVGSVRDTIAIIAHQRDAVAAERQGTRDRLRAVAALVELCRETSARLTAAADAARIGTDSAREGVAGARAGVDRARAEVSRVRAGSEGAGQAARRAGESVSTLQALAREIDTLVAGIEDVSFRTNLLALNAAVEAARAGEKGAGFAVVASEVRELSRATTKTTKTIRGLVNKGLAETRSGAEQTEILASLLCDIDAHLQNLSDETAKIGEGLGQGDQALGRTQSELTAVAEAVRAQSEALGRHKIGHDTEHAGPARSGHKYGE